jgi:DNA-directed RNA polymerase specialized sigma subunit
MSTAIYQAIKDNEKTVIELAKDYGVTRSTIYQSIGGSGSRAIRVNLALLAKIAPTKLWGNLYQHQLDDLFYEKESVQS